MKQTIQTHSSFKTPMTPCRVRAMQVIDDFEFFKLLFEPKTGYYFVYNNYTTASYFTRSFNTASSFFDRCIGYTYSFINPRHTSYKRGAFLLPQSRV